MKLNNSSRCRPRPCLCLPHSRPPNGVSLTNHHWPWILTSAANDSLISQWVFTRAFSWLKAFKLKVILRHYAKQALIPC